MPAHILYKRKYYTCLHLVHNSWPLPRNQVLLLPGHSGAAMARGIQVLFYCTKCPKSFRSPGALTRHKRVHTGRAPFSCGRCHKAFQTRGCALKHIETHTVYNCALCSETFSSLSERASHEKVHHLLVLNSTTAPTPATE